MKCLLGPVAPHDCSKRQHIYQHLQPLVELEAKPNLTSDVYGVHCLRHTGRYSKNTMVKSRNNETTMAKIRKYDDVDSTVVKSRNNFTFVFSFYVSAAMALTGRRRCLGLSTTVSFFLLKFKITSSVSYLLLRLLYILIYFFYDK